MGSGMSLFLAPDHDARAESHAAIGVAAELLSLQGGASGKFDEQFPVPRFILDPRTPRTGRFTRRTIAHRPNIGPYFSSSDMGGG